MATTSLGIRYYIKDGHRDTVLSKLKGVIDLCAREPEFSTQSSPSRLNDRTCSLCRNCGVVRAPIPMRYRASGHIAKHILQTLSSISKR
jgi:hypothetical protein